ncbi:MAG TPA: cyclopropane-fatty-acyl-phospholipid synthase family protein [Acidocella sp.]|nr:cyclopropane-fatty-acyl-phospholipid synthase family protein [Acidocella sp.]
MKTVRDISSGNPLSCAPAAGWRVALLRRMLSGLRHGRLLCTTPEGDKLEQRGKRPGPEANLVLHRWRALRALLLSGDDGFADGFLRGDWSSPDLAGLLTLAAQNFGNAHKPPLPLRLLHRLRHALNANSRAGSRRNIMAHYDLGNAFYAAWLDTQMLYSSALYRHPGESLEAAQLHKLALITDWLDIHPGSKVLEIGCGWGALAKLLGAAGARVTGLTLSPAQLAHAQGVIAANGLEERVELALRDYRDETGRYDRIVSVEMLEAVGEAYWPVYFRALRERLKPGGKVVLQVITIDAARFGAYRKNPDFIQRRIFPGGMLPAKAHIAIHAQAAGLVPARIKNFGESYALTLAAWRSRFLAAWPALAKMGFDDRFRRLWLYYLCYCEAGFRSGAIDVGLYELLG